VQISDFFSILDERNSSSVQNEIPCTVAQDVLLGVEGKPEVEQAKRLKEPLRGCAFVPTRRQRPTNRKAT
jgi:hypothetical protein